MAVAEQDDRGIRKIAAVKHGTDNIDLLGGIIAPLVFPAVGQQAAAGSIASLQHRPGGKQQRLAAVEQQGLFNAVNSRREIDRAAGFCMIQGLLDGLGIIFFIICHRPKAIHGNRGTRRIKQHRLRRFDHQDPARIDLRLVG